MLVNHGLGAFSRLGRRFPALIPRLNRTVTRVAGSSDRIDVSHRIFVSPRLVRFTEMEYAIPRRHAAEAIRAVRDRDPEPPAAGLLPDRGPVRRRGRRAALARPRARHLLHRRPRLRPDGVRALLPRGRGDHERLRWAPALGQAPLPDRRDAARRRYPEWDRFQAVRARFDPNGRFHNLELERVLGPVQS